MMTSKDVSGRLKIKPLVLLAFCVFVYPPKLMSASFLIPAVVYGISITYLLLNLKLLVRMCKKQRKIVFFALAIFLLSLVVPFISGTGDFSYSFSATGYFFKKGIVYLFLLCLIMKKHNDDMPLQYFMYYFAVTHVVYLVGTLLLVLFPAFQTFWFSIFNKESAEVLLRSSGYTFRLGWQGFAGFVLTLNCTISIIFLLFLRYGTRLRLLNVRQFVVPFVSCLVGNMFYGRVGLITTLLVSAVAVVFWNRKHIGRIVLFVGLGLALLVALNTLKESSIFSDWYTWMSRPIVNLIKTGEFNDGSFERLKEMNQVEISSETFLFGDGIYEEDGGYYMDTDAGFVRNILFWGIFGAILSYGLTFYSIIGLRKISKMMMLQMLIAFMAFEYKGAIYYDFITISFVLMVAFSASTTKRQFEVEKGSDELSGRYLVSEKGNNNEK